MASSGFNVYTPPLPFAGSTPYPGKERDVRRRFRPASPWPLKNAVPVFDSESADELERPKAPTLLQGRRGGQGASSSSALSVAPPPPPVQHRAPTVPSPERFREREPATVPEENNYALASEPSLEALAGGQWPSCAVIGARRRLMRWFPLNRPLNEGFRLTQHNLARACQEELVLTSVNGARLKGNTMGCFATRAGLTKKFYFVKSPWNRVYVFEEPSPRSRVAREKARLWAQTLASATEEPQSLPNAVSSQWKDLRQKAPNDRNWWFFDLR